MKRLAKTIAIALCAVVALSAFAGCKKKNRIDPDDPQKLEVYLYNAGYGYKWCEQLIDAFSREDWVKEKYPDLKTSFTKDEVSARSRELLTAGKKVNHYEVVFGSDLESTLGPEYEILDLTDSVYKSTVPGESITFEDKMSDGYLGSAKYRDRGMTASGEAKYYQVNWASGMTGIIYNENELKKLGKAVPNTTDELLEIMAAVKDSKSGYGDKHYSFGTYGASAYVTYPLYTWWAQYGGAEGYENFYNGLDDEETLSPEIFKNKGLEEALGVCSEIMSGSNGYTWLNPTTGREAYRETQNKVLMGDLLFMANGDWVDSELKELREGMAAQTGILQTVKLMRTPVISSIIDVLPKHSIQDDDKLSEVVAAIDAGQSSVAGVDPEDFARVKEARSIVYSIGPGHNAYIPSYASGKDVAVDFLRFLATDKAQAIYIKATNGASLPFKFDISAHPELDEYISDLQKGRLDYFSQLDVQVLPSPYSFPLVRYGNLSFMASGSPYDEFLQSSASAKTVMDREYGYWTANGQANWKSCLTQAGIN